MGWTGQAVFLCATLAEAVSYHGLDHVQLLGFRRNGRLRFTSRRFGSTGLPWLSWTGEEWIQNLVVFRSPFIRNRPVVVLTVTPLQDVVIRNSALPCEHASA